jgi:hypothetical protein
MTSTAALSCQRILDSSQPLRRRQNWPEALGAYLVAHMDRPHAWGAHDCVTFAHGAIEAITGTAIALPVAQRWTSQAEASATIANLGGLVAAVDAVLPRLPRPQLAQRGDIAIITAPDQTREPWLAVCCDGVAWAPAPTGLLATPLEHASIAWCVAHG